MQQSPMTGGQKGRSPKSAGRTQTRRRNGLGCLLLAVGLVLAAAALFKLEKPRLFDRVVPPGLYREVPPVTQLHPVLDRKKDELISLAAAKGIKVVPAAEDVRKHVRHPRLKRAIIALTGSSTVNTPAEDAGTCFNPVIHSHTVTMLAASE